MFACVVSYYWAHPKCLCLSLIHIRTIAMEILEYSSEHAAFVKFFGKEYHRYDRGMGVGVTPTQVLGHSSHFTTETFSMDANAKIAHMQNKIDSLKA